MKIKRKLEEQRRMQRIWKIYEHPLFIEGLVKNKDAEKERIFCHHDMNHFLDVARLMYIFSMVDMPLEKKRFMRRHYFMILGNGSSIRREFPMR
mgnify:CR=1 FL=1